MRSGIEVEVLKEYPEELHIFPRQSRRGKAQWAIWIKPDGSGTLFVGNEQIVLPKNASDNQLRVPGGQSVMTRNNQNQVVFSVIK